jgi:hypothetical protein
MKQRVFTTICLEAVRMCIPWHKKHLLDDCCHEILLLFTCEE